MGIYTYICFLSALSILIGFITSKISDQVQSTIAISAAAMVGSLLLLISGKLGWFQIEDIASGMMQQIDFKVFY